MKFQILKFRAILENFRKLFGSDFLHKAKVPTWIRHAAMPMWTSPRDAGTCHSLLLAVSGSAPGPANKGQTGFWITAIYQGGGQEN
jgi:hypothetical protein